MSTVVFLREFFAVGSYKGLGRCHCSNPMVTTMIKNDKGQLAVVCEEHVKHLRPPRSYR